MKTQQQVTKKKPEIAKVIESPELLKEVQIRLTTQIILMDITDEEKDKWIDFMAKAVSLGWTAAKIDSKKEFEDFINATKALISKFEVEQK